MKILLIDQAKKNFQEQDIGRWHFLPIEFENHGHKVLHITKQQWKKFLPLYNKFKPDIIITDFDLFSNYLSTLLILGSLLPLLPLS